MRIKFLYSKATVISWEHADHLVALSTIQIKFFLFFFFCITNIKKVIDFLYLSIFLFCLGETKQI